MPPRAPARARSRRLCSGPRSFGVSVAWSSSWATDAPSRQRARLSSMTARALVPLLGTTDVIDPRLGDEVLPTRSAEWLPDLHATISLAKRTGVVRIHRGRLVSTKKGRAVDRHADDPVFAAANAVVGIGPLQLCLGRRFGSPAQHWIDERSIHLLCDLHFAGGSVVFDDLVDDWRVRYEEVVDDLFISVRDELPEKRLDELPRLLVGRILRARARTGARRVRALRPPAALGPRHADAPSGSRHARGR